MFLTNVLLKKTKSKYIMVLMESVVSGHKFNKIRERLADKLEVIRFDPYMYASGLAEAENQFLILVLGVRP
ncbi:mitochondrial ribosomal protein L33 [Danaus plexippus plexippus]|uniref:Mitochondrial ribosomal protein L33 n=1 Tax=Danaus plexippus plexippus TaxID=278856 RepID=A0A212FG23_DANPL|nr:mitochondrial ribosomal protein L33 [Danaus plexippus plexippus]